MCLPANAPPLETGEAVGAGVGSGVGEKLGAGVGAGVEFGVIGGKSTFIFTICPAAQ